MGLMTLATALRTVEIRKDQKMSGRGWVDQKG